MVKRACYAYQHRAYTIGKDSFVESLSIEGISSGTYRKSYANIFIIYTLFSDFNRDVVNVLICKSIKGELE